MIEIAGDNGRGVRCGCTVVRRTCYSDWKPWRRCEGAVAVAEQQVHPNIPRDGQIRLAVLIEIANGDSRWRLIILQW